MMNWYDMASMLDDLNGNPAFLEKLSMDSNVEQTKAAVLANEHKKHVSCSWSKNHKYKKKLIHRFLAINPWMADRISRNSKVVLSQNGEFRKLGMAYPPRKCIWGGDPSKVTNRRIRQLGSNTEAHKSFSYYKKLYGPYYDDDR